MNRSMATSGFRMEYAETLKLIEGILLGEINQNTRGAVDKSRGEAVRSD